MSIGSVGDTQIVFSASEPKCKVQTTGDWTAAWYRTMRATVFIFGYRASEMQDYAEHIQGEFASKVSSIHSRIIRYDAAVREEVAGGQRIRLTDTTLFLRFYSAFVAPDGVEVAPSRKAINLPSFTRSLHNNKSNICNRFNSSAGCSASDRDCKYRHACKSCHKTGHSKVECDSGKQ
jgi:hypothetical protein